MNKFTGLTLEEVHQKCKEEIKQRYESIEKLEKLYLHFENNILSDIQRAEKLLEIRMQISQIQTELSVFIKVHDWINDWGL